MYFDWTYFVFVLPFAFIAMWASAKVKTTYAKYSQMASLSGYTAEQACRKVLDDNGLQHIRIERIPGQLTDHYDPRAKVIRLSDAVYGNPSQAAIGVACHEAGHAMQDAQDYQPLRLRNAIIPITNIGSRIALPLIMAGLLIPSGVPILAYIGIAAFSTSTLFQLFTLPTEFDASKRALIAIDRSRILNSQELQGSKKVLDAAALTYVAALAASIGQLLRLMMIVGNNSRNRR